MSITGPWKEISLDERGCHEPIAEPSAVFDNVQAEIAHLPTPIQGQYKRAPRLGILNHKLANGNHQEVTQQNTRPQYLATIPGHKQLVRQAVVAIGSGASELPHRD